MRQPPIWFSLNVNTYWRISHNERWRSCIRHLVLCHLLKMRPAYPKNLSRDVKLLDFLETSRIVSCVHEYQKQTGSLIRNADKRFNFSNWHRIVQESNFSRNFWSFHEKQKNNKSFLENVDYGYLILVTIDCSRKKFFAIKVLFRLTEKQFKKSFEDSRFGWRFSRSGITSKVFDNMALVFGFPTYYPMSR